jgi:hypothetical protein
MTEQSAPNTMTTPARSRLGSLLASPRARVVSVIVAVAVAGGIIAWIVLGASSNNSSAPVSVSPIAPVALSTSGLRTLAHAVRQPIYWAGPKSGYSYELTRTTNGDLYIRYLPAGVKAGAKGAKYLIVATYPFANAYRALQTTAKGAAIPIPKGGIALVDAKYPRSVHLAYPGVDYQVEIYDPSPAVARSVAISGDVTPAPTR